MQRDRPLCAWQRPTLPLWAGLLFLLVGLPLVFIPATRYPFEPPKVFLLRLVVVMIGTVATFRVSPQSWHRFVWLLRRSPLLPLTLLYSAILLVSGLSAADVPLSLWGTPLDHHGALTTLCCIIVGLALLWALPTAVQGQKLLRWLVVGSVPVCLYGLVQVFGVDPLPWATDSVSPLLSTLGRSNFVAAYLAMLLPLTLYLAQRLPGRHTWPMWLLFLLQSITLLWTQTRAGWLAGAVGIMVVLLGQLTKKKTAVAPLRLIGAVGLITLLSVAGFQQWREATTPPPTTANSYQELRTISVTRRLQIWQETWRLVPAGGWLGYGPEQFWPIFEKNVDVPALFDGVQAIVNDPHNIVLDQLMAVGFGGTAVFLILLITFYWLGIKHGGRYRWALLGSMTAFLVQATFTPDVVPTTLLFWSLVGMLAASLEWPQATTTQPAPGWQPPQIVWPRLAITQKQLGLLLLGSVVLGIGLFWRSYQLAEWLRFTGDETRDLFAAFQITQGTAFPSHGPKVHLGFGYLGPAYYYLLALPVWLFNGAPIAAGWLTVTFDVAAIGMVYLVGKRLFNATTGWIAALLYAFSFQVIFYARWGWHPSLVPFFTLLTIYGCLRLANGETRWFPTVMLAFSLAMQLHLTAVFLIVPILIVVWQQRRHMTLPLFGFALVVGLYPFLPLLTFEITQGYPNLRGMLSLAAFQESEVWTSPVGYLLNSLGTISTGAIIHKSVDLVGNGRIFTMLNLTLSLGGLFALWRWPPRCGRAIFASWALVPPLALAVYSGFRPDYYLITWFAVPLLLVAHGLGSLWANGRFRMLAPLLLLLILGLNLNTLSAYNRFMQARDQEYAHFHGNTLAHKEAIIELIANDAGTLPYELRLVTWAWPNHQPYTYLLMGRPNKPSDIWLYESTEAEAVYQEHWLDTRVYFAGSEETAVATYIITEPDSLPLPESLQDAEKIGIFGASGIYRLTQTGHIEIER